MSGMSARAFTIAACRGSIGSLLIVVSVQSSPADVVVAPALSQTPRLEVAVEHEHADRRARDAQLDDTVERVRERVAQLIGQLALASPRHVVLDGDDESPPDVDRVDQ